MAAIDLAYHVRTGDLILRTGAIPRVDTFTFTVNGASWLDQQWGAQILLAGFFRVGGWATLAGLQAALVGVSFALVYLACRESGGTTRVSSLVTLAGFIVAAPGLEMRPQIFALPLFAMAMWITAGRHSHPARCWALLPITIALANVHGSFPLIPLLVVLAWYHDVSSHSPNARRTLAFAAITLAATLCNPFGTGVWTYAYELATKPLIREAITEWAPLTLSGAVGWFTIGSAMAIAAYFGRRTLRVSWPDIVTLGVFLILALSAQRAIVWWGLLVPVVLAPLVPAPASARNLRGVATTRRESAGPAIVIVASLIAALAILAPWWKGASPDHYLRAAPVGLAAIVGRELPPGTRLLVHQPWGSWFEYAVPEMPVFVDSRFELVTDDVWDAYGEVAFAGAGWREALDSWDVEAIVAAADWELLPRLREDPGWRVVAEDEDGALLVRE